MTKKLPFLSAVKLLRYVCYVFFIPRWTRRRQEVQSSPLYDYYIADGVHLKTLERLVSVAKAGIRWRTTKALRISSTLPILLVGPAGNGKAILARRLAHCLGMNYFEADCFSLWSEVSGTGEAKIRNVFLQAANSAPCIFLLKRVDVLGKDASTNEYDVRVTTCLKNLLAGQPPIFDHSMIVIGTALQPDHVSSSLSSSFLYRFSIDLLNDSERLQLIEMLCKRHSTTRNTVQNPEHLRKIVQRTAGYAIADIDRLIETTRYLANDRTLDERQSHKRSESSDYTVGWADFEAALSREQRRLSDAIGAPKIPDVRWEDVGGLTKVKDTVLESIRMYLDYPQLSKIGFRRSGILLYGPPGCGKTLIAKAVATECSLNFMSVKGPELLNMYVGQSEQNIREVFERARLASPCVIFFDELDALAPNRGRSGDSGGVMDRVVSQLLAEMDGLEQRGDVFVIGATNRVDLIDPSLLRPGRFDKMVCVGIGSDFDSRLSVFKAVTRKLNLADDIDLEELVRRCPQGLSGADFYAVAAEAAMLAAQRKVNEIAEARNERRPQSGCDDEPGDSDEDVDIDCEVIISQQDFLHALAELKPSVSSQVLSNYGSSR